MGTHRGYSSFNILTPVPKIKASGAGDEALDPKNYPTHHASKRAVQAVCTAHASPSGAVGRQTPGP